VIDATKRIYLSAPRATVEDIEAVTQAMESGWLAPTGPDLLRFESAIARYVGTEFAVGLSSGTAAIHLALKLLGVGPGDIVITSTVTFAATVFPVEYLNAEPVFVDVDESWNLDPQLLEKAIASIHSRGLRVAAVIPVDLYGTPANYVELDKVLRAHAIPIVEDAAEALGARFGDRSAGSFGNAGILSFNGNKIITTSGGGMLVTNDEEFAQRTRFLSTQAREERAWYEHAQVGYNYRLSNLLAALGHSQLLRIDDEVSRRRAIREWYRTHLADVDGIQVQGDPHWATSNAWLTVIRVDSGRFPNAPEWICEFLDRHNVEARLIWKPMHAQPVFRSKQKFLNGNADALFREGVCLPSGSHLDEDDVTRICHLVRSAIGALP